MHARPHSARPARQQISPENTTGGHRFCFGTTIAKSGERQIAERQAPEHEGGPLLSVLASPGRSPQTSPPRSPATRAGATMGVLIFASCSRSSITMRWNTSMLPASQGAAISVMVAKHPGLSQRASRNGSGVGKMVTEVTMMSASAIASLAVLLATASRPRASAARHNASRFAAPRPKQGSRGGEKITEKHQMAARLNAATDEGDDGGVGPSQTLGRHRAQARGAPRRHPIAVDDRQRQSRVAVEQGDNPVDRSEPALRGCAGSRRAILSPRQAGPRQPRVLP